MAAAFIIYCTLTLYSIFTSDKGGRTCFRLSVCLTVSKVTQKRVHGFGRNVACVK